MSNSSASGFLGLIMLIATIASWIGSGIIAWNWAEPDSFWTALLFLLAWSLIGKAIDYVLALIIVGIANMLD